MLCSIVIRIINFRLANFEQKYIFIGKIQMIDLHSNVWLDLISIIMYEFLLSSW